MRYRSNIDWKSLNNTFMLRIKSEFLKWSSRGGLEVEQWSDNRTLYIQQDYFIESALHDVFAYKAGAFT